jgi:peroxiredoxin
MKKFFIMFIIIVATTVFINDCKKNEVVDNSDKKQEELVVGISYGNIATNFSEKDISGATFNLNDYKGKVIMLSFSAMWCGPCRAEAGELMELYNKYKERGFELVQCVYQDEQGDPADESDLKRWKEEFGITFKLISDSDYSTINLYKVDLIPTNMIINKDFVIKYLNTGFDKVTIESVILKSLK